MSTSLLDHVVGIRGYKYSCIQYDNRKVIFTIFQEPETYRCSSCGSARRHLSRPGGAPRRLRYQSAVGGRVQVLHIDAWNVRRVGWCVRSMCLSPNRDGATRRSSRKRRWRCHGA